MIKKLRWKFIGITMCSIVVVLGIIVGAINILNYRNVHIKATQRVDMIANGMQLDMPQQQLRPNKEPFHFGLSPEAPFDTRYFSVNIQNGEVASVDTGRIAAISSKTAEEYAIYLHQKSSISGFVDHYRYQRILLNDGVQYLFVDCERELSTFYTFLNSSLLISLIGILLVFLLVLFLSKLVVKPFAVNYQKQKEFITNAGHELKTPLTIIDANTEVLEMENGENEWTTSIRKQVKRLSDLTNHLVYLARTDEGDLSLKRTSFSLSAAILDTAEPFVMLAQTQQKQLKLNIMDSVTFFGDESALRQVIALLLDNALKYSSQNSEIVVTMTQIGKRITITCCNAVDEIAPGNLDYLFDRFYRDDASRNSQIGGHGIGLSVVKAVVQAHKGKISAQSDDGHSIRFTIQLG